MAAVGGDLFSISVKHPTLGSGKFKIKSGETSEFDTGGFRTNDDENGVTSDGEPIYEMSNTRWRVSATVRNDMNTAQDMEFAAALTGSTEEADFVITHINGAVYAGTGKPVGNVRANAKAATIALTFAGGGKLAQV